MTSLEYLTSQLEQDSLVRDQIRESNKQLEKHIREAQAILNKVHSQTSKTTPTLFPLLASPISQISGSIKLLATQIPQHQFYRYNDIFSRSLQNASFIVVWRDFLDRDSRGEEGQVLALEHVRGSLGFKEEWTTNSQLFLPVEEYLHSLISLLNELPRLAVNRVTLGEFDAPVRFARFAKDLSTAFSLLNLKNDSLRKRFDSIKYDIKKLEEIVYDLSLRGLGSGSSSSEASAHAKEGNGNERKRPAGQVEGESNGAEKRAKGAE
ncbi:Translin [Meredithblackwellia eburnea MCA 4105]